MNAGEFWGNKMPIKLKHIFEKTYTGKKVPKQYQERYGKTYSKKEADSIFYAFENKHKKKEA
jgi:hypothetical protein